GGGRTRRPADGESAVNRIRGGVRPVAAGVVTIGGKKSSVKIRARSSSSLYTAASSAGASPTSRFSASIGTKPDSSSSSRAAEYLAAHPPQVARSVSLTSVALKCKGTPRNGGP